MADPFAEPRTRRGPRATTTEVVAAGGGVALVAAFVLSPAHIADGPVICPFRRLTGLPCPGCGLTRSWVYLAHGWWRESFLANPFGVVAAGFALTLVVLVVRSRLRGDPPPDVDRLVRRRWVVAVLAVWLAWAVVRAGVDLATG